MLYLCCLSTMHIHPHIYSILAHFQANGFKSEQLPRSCKTMTIKFPIVCTVLKYILLTFASSLMRLMQVRVTVRFKTSLEVTSMDTSGTRSSDWRRPPLDGWALSDVVTCNGSIMHDKLLHSYQPYVQGR